MASRKGSLGGEGASPTPSEAAIQQATIISNGHDNAVPEKKTPAIVDASEKAIDASSDDEVAQLEDESSANPEIAQLPLMVRQTVSLTDDPSLPCITFRYFVLCILLVIPGAFLTQMSHFRTTQAPYSVFFVQIACHYIGHFLADYLPNWRVPVLGFSLNPAPWSIKEHVLVTLTAASGANYNLGYTPIAMAELWYGERMNPAVCIFFMLAIVWVGYALAAIARALLLWEPQYIWPQALMQTTLFETFRAQDRNSPVAKKQMIVFFSCLAGMTLWQFLPEYIFPFTSSLAFLCWVAPNNPVANFVGSGLGGMGFLNLSLDWSNINWNGTSIMIAPFWTQVILFTAFAFNCWVLLPAAKWGNLSSFKYGLMSNDLFLLNGTEYPTLQILTSDFRLNETALAELGNPIMGAQKTWATFFAYAQLPSALVWVLTFGLPGLIGTFQKIQASRRARKDEKKNGQERGGGGGGGGTIHDQYTDRLNILQRAYKEVPAWWYISLFLAGFLTLLVLAGTNNLFVPIWTVVVAILIGGIFIIPLGWLYAISNYQIAIGDFNELIYGYMIQTPAGEGHRHPCGPSTYGAIAGDAWYRAQTMLQDQRLGHYMHIPPRLVFFSQVFGTILGIPVNYGVVRWVLNTKFDYLSGTKTDPLHQWTGQDLVSSNTLGVQYAVIGPARLFREKLFQPLPYAFLFGALCPVVLYGLHRIPWLKKLRVDLWNCTIFFAGMAYFYGNVSTGFTSAIIGGWVTMYWAYRHHFKVWKRYNYLVAAAFDAAFNLNMLLIFLFFGSGKIVVMPNWWGNNANSVERCFALES